MHISTTRITSSIHKNWFSFNSVFFQIAEELTCKWLHAATTNEQVSLTPECFSVALKGLTRTCFGDLFQSEEAINMLTKDYDIVRYLVSISLLKMVHSTAWYIMKCLPL